ncbi:MAG: MarR family transcriptional regulator [Spirochaetales bacterium]|nr:MarR family transcriptional regulator [Spirochaetales bacterium]
MDSQELADDVVSTIRKIIRAIDLQSKRLVKKFGLTGPQLIVLKEIQKNSNRPISEIARTVSLSQATVTSILDRLEQQGFAQRHRSTQDKRKVNIELTDKAREILSSNPSMLQETFTHEFDKLEDWEKNMLLASLQRLAAMMDADEINAPPVLVSGPIAASSAEVTRYLDEENQVSAEKGKS